MYLVGVLFGFGFDIVIEIGLFVIVVVQVSQGLLIYMVMLFFVLFMVGMMLIDLIDNVLMIYVYGWVMDDLQCKLFYNVSIMFVLVVVVLVIGGIEVVGLLVEKLLLMGFVCDMFDVFGECFGLIGYGIVVLFFVCWIVLILFYCWQCVVDVLVC